MVESDCVKRAIEGDEDAFTLLVKKYNYLIKSTIGYYMHKRLVEDVSQEVWVQIYQKLWQLDDPKKFVPWARKLTYYHCVNHRKKANNIYKFELNIEDWVQLSETLSSDNFSVSNLIIKKEIRSEIRKLISSLPGDYAIMIRLKYLHDLNYFQIQELTGLPLSTIKWRIHHGKKLLKAKLYKCVYHEIYQ
ncbi:MAG: RNA polymerase sigma factor [Heyndrickxia sp.]